MTTETAAELWQDTGRPIPERVDALLSAMTLEEKAGQLGSYWDRDDDSGDAGGEGDGGGGDGVAPMESAMAAGRRDFPAAIEHGLGHLTRVFGTRPVTVPEGVATLRKRQHEVAAASRFGLGALVHEECLTGFTAYGATVHPTPLAWGATFDPGLIEAMAAAIGRDLRAVGVHQGLAPVLDVVRDYRWGRVEESIGEDPYLVGTVASAYVRGLQATGVIATLKHFVGYSASRSARNHAPVSMGGRELADTMLPPFEMAVREAGAGSVMSSYADVDGVPPSASRELLTGLLRDAWGFGGTVVSDYWGLPFLQLMHRVAGDAADAGRVAVTAGVDVELPDTNAYRHLPALVRAGLVDERAVDEAARRVLLQKAALGLLDAGWDPVADTVDAHDLDSPGNRALAASVAEKSIVLLANDGILPLERHPRRVAVIGTTAIEPRTFLGCYSFPNHVLAQRGGDELGVDVPTLLESLRRELPAADVVHETGCAITGDDRSGLAAAADLARGADVAVVTVGDQAGLFGRGTSGEGCDAADLTLPGVQAELVETVLGTGAPVVLVVVSGRPYALGAFAPRCAAVVQAFFPGEEGGPALAGVLSGRVQPGGRLPVAVPRTPEAAVPVYRAAPLARRTDGVSSLDPTPLYPFGHGLCYTSVAYDDLALSSPELPTDGSIEATVTVRNTGRRATEEVVQLYLGDRVAEVARPVRELIGYLRVLVGPGEARRVTFTVHADRTSFVGVDHRRTVRPGGATLSAGPSSENLPLSARIEITGQPRILDGARVMTTPARASR